MRGLLVAMLVLSGAAARADDAPMPEVPPACDAPTAITGVVREAQTNELAVGATIVVAGPTLAQELVAITDETGAFSFPVAPGSYVVTVYFADSTWEHRDVVVAHGHQVTLLAKVDVTSYAGGCDFGPPPVLTEAAPALGLHASRTFAPVTRDRTSRGWLAASAFVDPARAVTHLDDAHRLAGAFGVPLAFVDDVTAYSLRAPIASPTGSGGAADVTLVAGSNQPQASATAWGGSDRRGGGEALVRGPIATDHAWYAAGLAAARTADGKLDGDALLRLDAMPDVDHQLTLAGLGQQRADGGRDDWADLAYTGKLADNHVQLAASATAEHLALPADLAARAIAAPEPRVTDRLGGRAQVTYRVRLAGYHSLVAGAAGGGGDADGVPVRDASAYAGDDWELAPDVKVEAGVRGELRDFGGARARVVAPRLALDYDWTTEGRASAFVAYQRVPHLDDGAVGAWLASPARAHDEVAAGLAYEPASIDWLAGGVAARTRWQDGDRAHPGADAWLRIRGEHLALAAGASSLDRTVAGTARYRLGAPRHHVDVLATATNRAQGAGLAWSRRGDKDVTLDMSLQVFAGDVGPAARATVGASF